MAEYDRMIDIKQILWLLFVIAAVFFVIWLVRHICNCIHKAIIDSDPVIGSGTITVIELEKSYF